MRRKMRGEEEEDERRRRRRRRRSNLFSIRILELAIICDDKEKEGRRE